MLADGNGDFTRALGLEMDASKFGMGKRSQRYSMIVDNGVVKSVNVEEPGAFEVSSAEYLLSSGQLPVDQGAGSHPRANWSARSFSGWPEWPATQIQWIWWRAMSSSSARHRSSFLTGFLSAVFQPFFFQFRIHFDAPSIT